MITVELPGLTLTNEPHQRVPYLVDLEGWFDGVDLGIDIENRSNADGTFDQSEVFKNGRFPAVSGALLALNDSQSVWDLNDTLMALYSLGPFELAVTDGRGRRLTSTVRLGGKIAAPIDDENGQGSFVVPLWAKDPVKYNRRTPVSTGLPSTGGGMVFNAPAATNGTFDFGANGNLGRVTLTNNGNAEISPQVTISGGLADGFFINCIETAEVQRYERVVPPGSTVMIDNLTGEVVLDGQSDGSQYLTVADFFTVPPGEIRTLQFNAISSGDASALLTASDADGYW